MDIEAKRLDSLARNRASAALKNRYPREWEQLRRQIFNELKAEKYILGDVERTRSPIKHVDDGTGKCEECGRPAPCRQMRKRAIEKAARQEQPVTIPDE